MSNQIKTIQQAQKELPVKALTEEEKKHLHQLSIIAKQARGAYYPPQVDKASRELSKLLYQHLMEGVRYRELSEATELQWRSIKARLYRHGYIQPVPPSQQKKMFKGPKKPGPQCSHDPSRFRERIDKKTGKVVHIECLDCRKKK